MLPFTTSEFFEVFRRYNEAVWPAQWVLLAAAILIVAMAIRGGSAGGRWVAVLLAALWIWMGAVYHLGFFRRINPAATAFGALFIAQGAMMLWHGVRGRLTVGAHGARAAIPGALLVAYALVAYPAIGYALGHRYPMSPTFGLPCPTTIFTLGVLLWMRPPVPRVLFVIPVLWALVGTAAAMTLGVPEDIGLSVAAAIVVAVEIARSRPRSELRQRTHPA